MKYYGEVTVDDYYRATENAYGMARNREDSVHILLHYHDLSIRPHNLLPVVRYANKNVPVNVGLHIVHADTPHAHFSRMLIKLGHTLGLNLSARVVVVSTLAEAYMMAGHPPVV
ncbi:MAG: hypothetical protein AAFV33_09170 [Chloroflexota bacterium]